MVTLVGCDQPPVVSESETAAIISHAAKLQGTALMTCYGARLTREEARRLREARYAAPRRLDRAA